MPHLVEQALDLLIDRERGIWHLANRGAVTWAAFAEMGARAAGLETTLVRPVPSSELRLLAPLPRFSALDSSRGELMPLLEHALAQYFAESEGVWVERRRQQRVSVG